MNDTVLLFAIIFAVGGVGWLTGSVIVLHREVKELKRAMETKREAHR